MTFTKTRNRHILIKMTIFKEENSHFKSTYILLNIFIQQLFFQK